jgi:hypothetical protein
MPMTVRQAIRRADELRPNTLSDESKRLWLAQLDGVLRREVLGLHEEKSADSSGGAEETAIKANADGADKGTADDSLLLAPEPYSGVYLYWLMAQIDLTLGELARYGNDMALYNSSLNAFAVRYKAEHRPCLRGQFVL